MTHGHQLACAQPAMSLRRWDPDDDVEMQRYDATSSSSCDEVDQLLGCMGILILRCVCSVLCQICAGCSSRFPQVPIILKRLLRTASSETSGESTSISDSDSGSEPSCSPKSIDLTLDRLQSLHAMGSITKKELTDYGKKGISTTRIKSVATKPQCRCMCKIPVKVLYHLCVAFWTLAKPSQDSLLWSIQQGSPRKKKWFLGGLQVLKKIVQILCSRTV